eukprot:TRINITY_DN9604_c1_g1_i1.p1 TRINITY_DN9604_c1_g1~~TRINITY_DN9604_c1_g1_i1.p1  ORF type:complete len:408 (+),score=74.11 TRINITY_DN9604_c1_g1_i1:355-1578(+)
MVQVFLLGNNAAFVKGVTLPCSTPIHRGRGKAEAKGYVLEERNWCRRRTAKLAQGLYGCRLNKVAIKEAQFSWHSRNLPKDRLLLVVHKMEEVITSEEVKYDEEFITNTRGVKLFTCSWLPLTREPKAIVCLCHGYGMEVSVFMAETGVRLAGAGYAVFGIDAEGHGKSDGMRAYVRNFDNLVEDSRAYFQQVREKEQFKNKPQFLYGESMGGAVVLRIHFKEPEIWSGAVLLAPMVKISEKLKPPAVVTAVMSKLALILPTWKIVPAKDIIDSAFKDEVKRAQVRQNPYVYQDKPRLRTALEMLNNSLDLEKHLADVTIPFFLLHGGEDTVTDPEISALLYEKASSRDKTFKTYPGMWHCLTSGEPDENVELVFRDIFSWLNDRSSGSRRVSSSSPGAPPVGPAAL